MTACKSTHPHLTPPQRRALRELWLAEQPGQPGSPPYPGAVGHVGVTLVKMGYAERLGTCAYGGGIRLVRYQLTPAGRQAATSANKATAQ